MKKHETEIDEEVVHYSEEEMNAWPQFVKDWFKKMEEEKGDDGEKWYENMDNYRAVNILSPVKEQIRKYETKKKDGCCGEVEKTLSGDGEIWRVGFNYGH